MSYDGQLYSELDWTQRETPNSAEVRAIFEEENG